MSPVPINERRRLFIDAATSVIAEYGVAGATTRRIAEAADAPLASLHYCYDTKEDLLAAIWEENLTRLESRYRESQPSQVDLASAAVYILRSAIDWMVSHEDLAVASAELLFWARRQEAQLGKRAFEIHFLRCSQYLRQHLAPHDREELVAPLADFIAVAYDGMTLQWSTLHDVARLDKELALCCSAIELLAMQSVEGNSIPRGVLRPGHWASTRRAEDPGVATGCAGK